MSNLLLIFPPLFRRWLALLCFFGVILLLSSSLHARSPSASPQHSVAVQQEFQQRQQRTPPPIVVEKKDNEGNSLVNAAAVAASSGALFSQRTFLQQFSEAMIPSVIESFGTYPWAMLNYDAQSGAKLSDSLKWRNLHRGFTAYMWVSLPAQAVLLGAGRVFNVQEDDPATKEIAVGVFAGVLSGAMAAPFELIGTQQRIPGKERNVKQTLKDLWKTNGIRAFKQGMVASVARNVLTGVGLFGVPTLLRRTVLMPGDDDNRIADMLSVMLGGAIMSVASQPLDTARGYLQQIVVERGKTAPSTIQAMKHLYRKAGNKPNLLFKGVLFRAGTLATSYLILDTSALVIEGINDRRAQRQQVEFGKSGREKQLWQKIADSRSASRSLRVAQHQSSGVVLPESNKITPAPNVTPASTSNVPSNALKKKGTLWKIIEQKQLEAQGRSSSISKPYSSKSRSRTMRKGHNS